MSVQRGATATIPINTAVSNAIDLWNMRLVGLIMPAAWTAADVAFQVAQSGDAFTGDNTYRNLVDEAGNRVFVVASAGVQVDFKLDLIARLKGVRHIKFVSYASGSAANTNQAQEAVLIPIVSNHQP